MNPNSETEWLNLQHLETNDYLGNPWNYDSRKVLKGAQFAYSGGLWKPVAGSRGPIGGWVQWPFDPGSARKTAQWGQAIPVAVTNVSPLKVRPIHDCGGSPFVNDTTLNDLAVTAPSGYTSPTVGDVGIVVQGTDLGSKQPIFFPFTSSSGGGGGGGGGAGTYGDGSDGAVSLDGVNGIFPSTTYSQFIQGAHFSGHTEKEYILLRDLYCTTLSVSGTSYLHTRGFRIFATVGVTVAAGSEIRNSSKGSAVTPFLTYGVADAVIGPLTGSGMNPGNGTNGAGSNLTLGGTGGAGGTGSGGGSPGGTGGVCTSPETPAGFFGGHARVGGLRALPRAIQASWDSYTYLGGGSPAAFNQILLCRSGGQGGGGGGVLGGGGGDPGGVMVIAAKAITNNGSIHCDGMEGQAAVPSSNMGGGGGGGGGVAITVCESYSGAAITCNGGAAGAGDGTGLAGQPGMPGAVLSIA